MSSEIADNFGGLSADLCAYQSSKIAVLPIPFDMTSSWLVGSDKGPQALMRASQHMELFDIETQSEVYKHGIYTAPAIEAQNSKQMLERSYQSTSKLLADGKFVLSLGGEHAVSPGPIRAHAEKFGSFSVLQFDAHTDLRDNYEGDPLSHASAMARTREISGVDRVVAVGIRAIDSSERAAIKREDIFYAEEIYDSTDWIPKVISRLSPKVYITFDLDVFDQSIMPSTGTPEPGGLSWYAVLKCLRAVFAERQVVGCDIVELMPNDVNRAPDFLAAKLAYKILTYRFSK